MELHHSDAEDVRKITIEEQTFHNVDLSEEPRIEEEENGEALAVPAVPPDLKEDGSPPQQKKHEHFQAEIALQEESRSEAAALQRAAAKAKSMIDDSSHVPQDTPRPQPATLCVDSGDAIRPEKLEDYFISRAPFRRRVPSRCGHQG